jgi:hypothetical protein
MTPFFWGGLCVECRGMTGAQGMLIVLMVISILAIIVWPPLAVVAVIGIGLYVFIPPQVVCRQKQRTGDLVCAMGMSNQPDVGEGLETHLESLEVVKKAQDEAANAVGLLVDAEIRAFNEEVRADVAARPEDHTGAISVAMNNAIGESRARREKIATLLAPDTKYYKMVHDPTGLREQRRLDREEEMSFYSRGNIDNSLYGHYDS